MCMTVKQAAKTPGSFEARAGRFVVYRPSLYQVGKSVSELA